MATIKTLKPSSFNFLVMLITFCLVSLLNSIILSDSICNSWSSPGSKAYEHNSIISSTAPLQIKRCLLFFCSSTTDILLLWKSNGISSTFLKCSSTFIWSWTSRCSNIALSIILLNPV